MNFNKYKTVSVSRNLKAKPGFYLGLLLGLAMLLAACGETAAINNVAFPIPTVTPLPGMANPVTPTATPPPPEKPSPVAQPVNATPAQPLDRLPMIEGTIEAVAIENNLSVLTVNQTHYTIIPEITTKIGKWFKEGNHIKMTGTRYSDGSNVITLVVNVTGSEEGKPKKPDKGKEGDN